MIQAHNEDLYEINKWVDQYQEKMEKALNLATKELEFCLGTAPFCDKKRIEKTLKKIKKALTMPEKKAIIKTVNKHY